MRFKLTSPGVLLILATLAAGGIFLLDLSYLRPHFESHCRAAVQDVAARAEQSATVALRDSQELLGQACTAWAENPVLGRFLETPTPRGAEEFERLAEKAFRRAAVENAWLCDASGEIVQAWARTPAAVPEAHGRFSAGVRSAVRELIAEDEKNSSAGLVQLPGGAALFARCAIRGPARSSQVAGHLLLAHYLNCGVLEHIGSVTGAEVVLVAAEELPETAPWWLTGEDTIALAWAARGPAGKRLGHFRADLPIKQIHLQFTGGRRIILIILSLSVGLVLLIVLGMHMLITGPLVRLLSRLQKIEAGDAKSEDLTRSLHGEPLVLARRLESAFDKLAHMSKTDTLTSLSNRRHFEHVLGYFYHQARRYNRRLSLMVLDIDFFKAINDTGGHQVGDAVLKALAENIAGTCRNADLPARLGGDEFAVLMPETNVTGAVGLAERIRQAVAAEPVKIRSLELNITTSIGVTDLNVGEVTSPGKMLALADRALYAAKELGRNRVVLAHDLEGLSLRRAADDNKLGMIWKQLARVDTRLKGLFLGAMEDIYQVLQHRDVHIAQHARKVRCYAALIAREMELPDSVVDHVKTAAIMHDIGMLAMPDSILLCAGPLSEEQWRLVRQHPLLSVQIMEGMQFLEREIPAVRHHHERYDGRGYPEGIAGAAIPLSARILAVADCLDAMTSPRHFRAAKSMDQAVEEIRSLAGTQFDPVVVDAFLQIAERLGEELMRLPSQGDAGPDPEAPRGEDQPAESVAESSPSAEP